MCGSSPLARGTYLVDGLQNVGRRLIPARAGNICWRSHDGISRTAHPRSRGEHGFHHCHAKGAGGSSPLARGTLPQSAHRVPIMRLIPARAGNIERSPRPCRAHPAHPRSRGEHSLTLLNFTPERGSSPLARGTLAGWNRPSRAARLIPARAGNIRIVSSADGVWAAHPRSRGEHTSRADSPLPRIGSSPLARGTYFFTGRLSFLKRLIPARAGNISRRAAIKFPIPAHPRSRGEHK